jgi:hypothetical protein
MLTSDKPDYAPGSLAILTGSGFSPSENVRVTVVHADGTPSTVTEHDPWISTADINGRFVTAWHVPEEHCLGVALIASAHGLSSKKHAETAFTDNHVCGTGVVSMTAVGGSCLAVTPAVAGGPDNVEVEEGGTYSMTISNVTECTGSTITVFIQSSSVGNFCFPATGGSGTYVGTFTMPDPACHTMPISYKCGASAACTHPNSFTASGPTLNCKAHLRTSNFGAGCVKTSDDDECAVVGCVTTYTLGFTTDDQGNAMVHGQHIDTEYQGGPVYPVTITSSVNGSGNPTAAILNSNTGPAAQDPDLLVGLGNILILQTDANLNECPPASGVYCSHNDDEDGGSITFVFPAPCAAGSIDLVDIDALDPVSTVVLTDVNGFTRTYTVPANWTGDVVSDGPPGFGTLLFTVTSPQAGFASSVTAVEDPGYDPTAVMQIDVNMGGSAGVDNLVWCL